MCLMFRIGDMRHDSALVGAEMSVQLVQRKVSISLRQLTQKADYFYTNQIWSHS